MKKFPKGSLILTIILCIFWKCGSFIVNVIKSAQSSVKGVGSGLPDIPFIKAGVEGATSLVAGSFNVLLLPISLVSGIAHILTLIFAVITIILIIRWLLSKRKAKNAGQPNPVQQTTVVNTPQPVTPVQTVPDTVAESGINKADSF